MHRFERKQNVSTNKDTLGESYRPERIEEHDDEISEYMDVLQPVVDGWEPNSVSLYGNTSVGKTTVTEFLLEMFLGDVSQYDDVDLSVIPINYKTFSSSYQVTVEFVNEPRPPGAVISSTGYPQQTIFKKLFQELDGVGGTVLIVLDEVGSIGDRDELLYELPRARSDGKLEDAKVGLIGISNDFKFHGQLDPRVQDTLCERELHSPPYQASELQNILESHAETAIVKDTCEKGVLNLCAALAARDSGNAWQALNLLRLADEHAESKDDERITLDHANITRQRLEQERVVEEIRELTENGHFTLFAVVSKAAHDEIPCRMRDLYQEYLRLCNSVGIDPLAQRSIHDHLSDLRILGIPPAKENRIGSRGDYYSYALDVPLPNAMEALSDVLALDSILDEIRKTVTQAEAA